MEASALWIERFSLFWYCLFQRLSDIKQIRQIQTPHSNPHTDSQAIHWPVGVIISSAHNRFAQASNCLWASHTRFKFSRRTAGEASEAAWTSSLEKQLGKATERAEPTAVVCVRLSTIGPVRLLHAPVGRLHSPWLAVLGMWLTQAHLMHRAVLSIGSCH